MAAAPSPGDRGPRGGSAGSTVLEGRLLLEVSSPPRTPGSPGCIVASVVTIHNHQGVQSLEGLVAGGLQDLWAAHTADPQAHGLQMGTSLSLLHFQLLLVNGRT